MEELQRYWTETDNPHTFSENADGAFVRFSDVQEREARFQARIEELAQDRDDMTDTILGLRERIEELEVIVSGKTMYDAAAVVDARWREQIEAAEKLADALKAKWDARNDALKHGGLGSTATEHDELIHAYRAFRSLLDSGEIQNSPNPSKDLDSGEEGVCPKCGGKGKVFARNGRDWYGCYLCSGSGRATPSQTQSSGGVPQPQGRGATSDESAVPNSAISAPGSSPAGTPAPPVDPSPVLHREGRGDFIGDDLSGVHTCHAECPCRESGPDPVAVPEKVEVNREDLELILTDTDIYYPGYAEGSDEPSGLPERGAAAEDRLRAALAAFRATEDGSHE